MNKTSRRGDPTNSAAIVVSVPVIIMTCTCRKKTRGPNVNSMKKITLIKVVVYCLEKKNEFYVNFDKSL